MERIRRLIIAEASRSAQAPGPPNMLELSDAAKKFAPGLKYPDEPTLWQRLASSLSGVTLICAALAVIFGVLGATAWKSQESACFDIAKIFAGAVVGSTTVGAVVSRRK